MSFDKYTDEDMLITVCAWISSANGHSSNGAWKILHYGDDYVDVMLKETGDKFRISVHRAPNEFKT